MLKRVFGWIAPLCLGVALSTAAVAQSKGLKKGPEISAERKSEQELEHGNAYAGTREKKADGEMDVDQDKIKKDKKERAEKKMKEEKLKREKVAKQQKDKMKEKKDKSSKKDKLKDKGKNDKAEKDS